MKKSKTYEEGINKLAGANLRNRRKQLGLTQEDLAALIGLSRASVANMENGTQGLSVSKVMDIHSRTDIKASDIIPASVDYKMPKLEHSIATYKKLDKYSKKDIESMIKIYEACKNAL